MPEPRIIEIRKGVLKKNDEIAHRLRARFRDAGVVVIDVVSSPGSGKTDLLEHTLGRLKADGSSVAALVGDLETDNDSNRLARSGVPVRQIQTHGICHLDASMIENSLAGWELDQLDFLFIENVGNLVCPASYDLGENVRVVLHSVTEGEDKPLKYPTIFNSADVAVVTKIDLAEACEFNREACYGNIRAVRPGIRILETSAKKGIGLDQWVSYITNLNQHS